LQGRLRKRIPRRYFLGCPELVEGQTFERSEFYSGQAKARSRNRDARRVRSSGRVACVPAP
ncbi:MAG: hypothetical protein AAB403_07595, partial [Planctomycetota bacterium]